MSVRTVKTWADYEGIHVEILDESGATLARGYGYAASHGGWEGAKQAAIADARRKLDTVTSFGPAPEAETFPLDGATVTELHGA